MELRDYVGRAPSDGAEGTRIDRVTAHHVWDVNHKSTAECANCGTGISLGERHLLVRLISRSRTPAVDRQYLCNERCIREWVEEAE